MKETSIANHVKSLGYIECYSWTGPRPVKSPSNSIRCNCQKICIWSRRPKTILEIRKKTTFLWVINKSIIFKFLKDFTKQVKKANRTVAFSDRPFRNVFKNWDHRWDLLTIWNTRLLQIPIEEFFRTNTGILVLEGKTGKETPYSISLEF